METLELTSQINTQIILSTPYNDTLVLSSPYDTQLDLISEVVFTLQETSQLDLEEI